MLIKMSAAMSRPPCLQVILCLLVLLLAMSPPLQVEAMDFLSCQMRLDPVDIHAKPLVEEDVGGDEHHHPHHPPAYDQFRCEATLPSATGDTFSYPAFDVTFEISGLDQLYIIRERAECSTDKLRCWKDFHISAPTLRSLITPMATSATGTNNNNNNNSTSSSYHNTSINYTCALADTSSNRKKTIRCHKQGHVFFGRVLGYGQPCQAADNTSSSSSDRSRSLDQCAPRLQCLPTVDDSDRSTCRCVRGSIAYKMTPTRTVCFELVNLWGKCNFTGQCQANDANTECAPPEGSANDDKICKCLQGYESRVREQSEAGDGGTQFYCKAIKADERGGDVGDGDGRGRDTGEEEEEEEMSKRCPPTSWRATTEGMLYKHEELVSTNSNDNTTGTNLASLPSLHIRSTGFYVLIAVLIISAIIVAIIIRHKNHGLLRMEGHDDRQTAKKITRSNGSGKSAAPLLEAMCKLGETKEEEEEKNEDVEIAIEEDDHYKSSEHTATGNGKSGDVSFNFRAKQSIV